MKYVLFVCTQNAGRSQMAQAFFERHAPPDVRIGKHAGSVLSDRDYRQHHLRPVATGQDAGGLVFGRALPHDSSDRTSVKPVGQLVVALQ
jgi:Low molecular weight phosphotyrosine protein phosphatase